MEQLRTVTAKTKIAKNTSAYTRICTFRKNKIDLSSNFFETYPCAQYLHAIADVEPVDAK